jgi:hypothetical protein
MIISLSYQLRTWTNEIWVHDLPQRPFIYSQIARCLACHIIYRSKIRLIWCLHTLISTNFQAHLLNRHFFYEIRTFHGLFNKKKNSTLFIHAETLITKASVNTSSYSLLLTKEIYRESIFVLLFTYTSNERTIFCYYTPVWSIKKTKKLYDIHIYSKKRMFCLFFEIMKNIG